MSFKDISIFSFGGHFVQLSENSFSNFGCRHYGEHSCGIILDLTSGSTGDVV